MATNEECHGTHNLLKLGFSFVAQAFGRRIDTILRARGLSDRPEIGMKMMNASPLVEHEYSMHTICRPRMDCIANKHKDAQRMVR